ncbi:MAG TPA: DUF1949 domain-containing protein, partial [Jeotgalicoccus sp.]|nr:DUF1949 domain-containing protein [Jeotgalicoccus sp.]
KFEYFLGNENIEIKDQEYTDKVTYHLMIEEPMVEKVRETLKEITSDAFLMTTKDVEMAERVLVL